MEESDSENEKNKNIESENEEERIETPNSALNEYYKLKNKYDNEIMKNKFCKIIMILKLKR
jgi:hypothetical protein